MEEFKDTNENLLSGIYQIKNLVNNKVYIGSAVNLKMRRLEHLSNLKYNKHHSNRLQRSWNKYTENDFEFTIIEYCDKNSLIEREQFWIDKAQSYIPSKGFNICKIAGNSLGYKHTPKSIDKMKAFGKSRPVNWKAVEAMKKATKGSKRPYQSKTVSDRFSKPIVQLSLDGKFIKEWKSIAEANKFFGDPVNNSNISKCANKKCKSSHGFIWLKKDEYSPSNSYNYVNDRGKLNKKIVYQYALDGTFIKEWSSSNEAAKFFNIHSSSIYNCLYGKAKSCKGFKWTRNKNDEISNS